MRGASFEKWTLQWEDELNDANDRCTLHLSIRALSRRGRVQPVGHLARWIGILLITSGIVVVGFASNLKGSVKTASEVEESN